MGHCHTECGRVSCQLSEVKSHIIVINRKDNFIPCVYRRCGVTRIFLLSGYRRKIKLYRRCSTVNILFVKVNTIHRYQSQKKYFSKKTAKNERQKTIASCYYNADCFIFKYES